MNESFINGFLKEAQSKGCTLGEAWDILKCASMNGNLLTPAPAKPLVDTIKPSTMFPMPSSTSNNSGSWLSTKPTSQATQNFNQMGQGGANNNVTSALPSSINSAMNKPTPAPTTPVF